MRTDYSGLTDRLREAVDEIMLHQFTHSREAMTSLQNLIDVAEDSSYAITEMGAELARRSEVIAKSNSRCDHLGMRLGEVMRERDAAVAARAQEQKP